MIRTMKLLGVSSIHELDRSYIDVPAGWRPGDDELRKGRAR